MQRHGAGTSYQLLRKPQDVPSAQTLDVLYNNFKAAEIESGDSIKGDIEKNQRPFEEGIDRVGSRHAVNLVLNEKVYQRNKGSEKGAGQVFPQLDRLRVWRAESQTSKCPWQCRNQIADHKDIMPVMVIRARNVCPASTSQCSKDAHSCNELGQAAVRSVGQTVEEENKQESRSRANGDEDLENGSFGIAVADGCTDRWEPLNRVSEVLVLDDFVVMERHAHDQGTDECRVRRGGMKMRDPLAWYLESCQTCRVANVCG